MDKKTLLEALKRGKECLVTPEEAEEAQSLLERPGKSYCICYAIVEGIIQANLTYVGLDVCEAVQALVAPHLIDNQGQAWDFYSGVLRSNAQREGRTITDSEVQQARHRLLDTFIQQLETEFGRNQDGQEDTA